MLNKFFLLLLVGGLAIALVFLTQPAPEETPAETMASDTMDPAPAPAAAAAPAPAPTAAAPQSSADAEAAIAAAKSAQQAAATVKGEWRDTGKIIKKAEEALAGGDAAKAIEFAKQAEQQGLLGEAQALSQVGVGNPDYLTPAPSTATAAPAAAATGTATEAMVNSAIEAAVSAQKAASKVGGEWRDTGKIVKAAQAALADGKLEEALKLAKKAEAQGQLGKEQALSQVGVGNPEYLY